jgi:predicted glycogen debranching enzyme
MSYLKIDKEQLINLEYSLNREILRSNRAGSYISTSLNGCNTRKYHGLLVCNINNFGREKHVLLSSLDVSIVQGEEEYKMGIHRYQGGIYEPNGHKYIQNIEFRQNPRIIYRIGSIIFTMERILHEKKKQIMIQYVLEEAPSNVTLRFRPFLAFRNVHNLSKANLFVNNKFTLVKNGISTCLYDGYPDLFMQFSRKNEFIPVPGWYYNIEYIKELNRGYDYLEDLYVPGYFELDMEPGETMIFSAATEYVNPTSMKQCLTRETSSEKKRFTLESSLKNAAEQFIYQNKNETGIIAGFPWYDSISRQTFISLPGLSSATGNAKLFPEVLNTYKPYLNNGLFPDNIFSSVPVYNSADAPLWFIWAVQQYASTKRSPVGIWLSYSSIVKKILESWKDSLPGFIHLTDEGLIYAEKKNTSLTWMDSYVNGIPVVQRSGLAVEINALWYNAIAFALEMSRLLKDREFLMQWEGMEEKAGRAFMETFWNHDHEHLADVVKNGITDWSVRPNMIIAAALKYSPLSKDQKKMILNVSAQKLLTPRGLRSLSPDHLRYKGDVTGNPDKREAAIHQGAVWPWLMQFFTEAYLDVHGASGVSFLKQHLDPFEDALTEHCIGTLSETYNGDPPYKGKGAVSQAWNVAGIYHALNMIQNYKR